MKREHIQSESYIDWLKSIGCLVYLPLSESGDLQDRISGLSLQVTGQGSMVWDGAKSRYKFTTPSSVWQKIAILNNGLTAQNFPSNTFTCLYTVRKITSSSSRYIRGLQVNSNNASTVDAMNPAYNGSSRSSGYPTSEVKVAGVCNGTVNRSYYQNGALYGTYSPYDPYIPSNWVLLGDGIYLGCTSSSGTASVQYYMSEIYLFNTALDLTTIRKIQGYE